MRPVDCVCGFPPNNFADMVAHLIVHHKLSEDEARIVAAGGSIDDGAKSRRTGLSSKVRDILVTAQKPLSVAEIAQEIGCSNKQVGNLMETLQPDMGLERRTVLRDGRWTRLYHMPDVEAWGARWEPV